MPLFVSLMVESQREAWHEIVKRTQDAGADGIELNFGCPHGMSERGMGSAVGQVPEYAEMITGWVKEVATVPVIVKLTPNVADVTADRPGGGRGGGRRPLADQHDQLGHGRRPRHPGPEAVGRRLGEPRRLLRAGGQADRAEHGRRAWPETRRSACRSRGIGGIETWQDAAEFFLLGPASVQVCTAVMHHGFRVVDGLIERPDGLDAVEGVRAARRHRRPVGPPDQALGRARPELQGRRRDRPGQVHPLRALLRRLRGRLPPVDPLGPACPTAEYLRTGTRPRSGRAASRCCPAPAMGSSTSSRSSKTSASAATCAAWSARSTGCITMKPVDRACRRCPGTSTRPGSPRGESRRSSRRSTSEVTSRAGAATCPEEIEDIRPELRRIFIPVVVKFPERAGDRERCSSNTNPGWTGALSEEMIRAEAWRTTPASSGHPPPDGSGPRTPRSTRDLAE